MATSTTSLPLAGIRVVEATQMVAGPFAGAVLVEQGAEVIKVEQPDGLGDRYRLVGTRRGDMGANFQVINRGKRSIAVNSKDPAGLQVMHRLIASADVFIQNFRPGTADRLGFGADAMCSKHPDLVYVSVTGFGTTGPDVEQKVYDYVVQARTGMAALQADELGGPPKLISQIVVDKVTAMQVSQAVTAALLARERGQGGQHVQLSMLDMGVWFFWGDGMMDKTLIGDENVFAAPHVSQAYEVFKTQDGWLTTLVMTSDRSWPKLCAAFAPELEHQERFATREAREDNLEELLADFRQRLSALTIAEALAAMRANDVPGSSVTPREALHLDPQLMHNDTLVEVDDGPAGPRREARPPVQFGTSDSRAIPPAAPLYAQHSTAILEELGYTADEIVQLQHSGSLGPLLD